MKQSKWTKAVKTTLKLFAKNSANSATSGTIFQPVVPAKLKNFSRFNDK